MIHISYNLVQKLKDIFDILDEQCMDDDIDLESEEQKWIKDIIKELSDKDLYLYIRFAIKEMLKRNNKL